jgi:HK97 family phage portal protein
MLADRVTARAEAVRSADPVSMDEFGVLLGAASGNGIRTKAGTTVGPTRALGISAWYSGVRYISETMAGLPVHRYRDVNGVRDRRADPSWMKRPDDELTWHSLVEFVLMSLLHKGDSYAFKLRNPIGQVTGLREIHPDRVTGRIAPDGRKRFMVDRDEFLYTTREILHIPGLSYNGRFGMNPIQFAANSLGAIAAADDHASYYFANGTNLGGIISVDQMLTPAEAIELKQQWDDFHKGIVNAHQTGVLSKGATYSRINLDAASTQLLESRQYGVSEVSRWLRIPPHKLYDLTRATFSNIEHQSIEAITDGIQPWAERLEAHINADRDLTPAGTFIEFQLEGRLRGDIQSQNEAFSKSVGGPWQTVNEIRRIKNLPPVEGGDEILAPLNMTQVGAIGDGTSPMEAA